MITGLCNIYINTNSKCSLFKETFPLVYEASDNWLINIRGKFQKEIIDYIKHNFLDCEEKCIFFSSLDESNWSKSTYTMLKQSRYDYVYVFLEDHFLLKPIEHFKNVIKDMMNEGIEYFQYSFFNIGISSLNIEALHPHQSKEFFIFQLEAEKIDFLRRNNRHFYPYALPSISSKNYFNKILKTETKTLLMVPRIIQILMENMFFAYPKNRKFWFYVNSFASKLGVRFIIYPPETPFNLEKSLFDCSLDLLPIKVGCPKDELFTNWDDDNKLSNSSLIKRGLYPTKLHAKSYIGSISPSGIDYIMVAGESKSYQYCPDIPRVEELPMKYVLVKSGSLEISSHQDSYVLEAGMSMWIHANIEHIFFSKEGCVYFSCIEVKED